MRRIWLIALLMLCVPATARAASGLYGDGERYAAWETGAIVHVLDDQGPARTIPLPDGCQLEDLSAGRLLFDCTPVRDGALIQGRTVDLATGTVTELPTWDPRSQASASPVGGWFSAIGRHWAAISISAYHWNGTVYVPLAGGAPVVRARADDDPYPPTRSVIDLDAVSLDVPLCAPLRIPGSSSPPAAIYRRSGLLVRSSRGDLWRHRCGSRARQRVARGVARFVAGPGVVAWIDGIGEPHLRTREGTHRLWPSVQTVSTLVLTGRRAVAMTQERQVLVHRLTTGSGG